MKKYLIAFFEKFSYPEEAARVLLQAWEKIMNGPETKEKFEALLARYEADRNADFQKLLEDMEGVSAAAEIHKYTGDLLLPICMSQKLREYYQEDGLSEEMWFTSMCDLKYKLIECHEIYGIWGTFVAGWFSRFFYVTRFGFGKLQFETVTFEKQYEKDGVVLKPGATVINVHIPRTGGKLDRESKDASYRQAAEFYSKLFEKNPPVFVCHSWLLFPRNKEVLSPESNLYAFIADFDIIEQKEYEDYSQVWRLFDKEYQGDVEALPQNTSLRRAYADWIRKGEKTGWGYGVYVWK